MAAPPGEPSSYTFAFWAVPSKVQPTQFTNGVPDSLQVITFVGPPDESFNATACSPPSWSAPLPSATRLHVPSEARDP